MALNTAALDWWLREWSRGNTKKAFEDLNLTAEERAYLLSKNPNLAGETVPRYGADNNPFSNPNTTFGQAAGPNQNPGGTIVTGISDTKRPGEVIPTDIVGGPIYSDDNGSPQPGPGDAGYGGGAPQHYGVLFPAIADILNSPELAGLTYKDAEDGFGGKILDLSSVSPEVLSGIYENIIDAPPVIAGEGVEVIDSVNASDGTVTNTSGETVPWDDAQTTQEWVTEDPMPDPIETPSDDSIDDVLEDLGIGDDWSLSDIPIIGGILDGIGDILDGDDGTDANGNPVGLPPKEDGGWGTEAPKTPEVQVPHIPDETGGRNTGSDPEPGVPDFDPPAPIDENGSWEWDPDLLDYSWIIHGGPGSGPGGGGSGESDVVNDSGAQQPPMVDEEPLGDTSGEIFPPIGGGEDPPVSDDSDDDDDDGFNFPWPWPGGDDDDNGGGDGVSDPLSGFGEFLTNVFNDFTSNFDLNDLVDTTINFQQSDAMADAAEKQWNTIWDMYNRTRDDLKDERDIGQAAIEGGLWNKMSRELTPDARENLLDANPDTSTGMAGQFADVFEGFKDLTDTVGKTGAWDYGQITEGSDAYNQLTEDAVRMAENASKARGRLNSQEARDSVFKSYVRAMGDIEDLNASRLNQEIARRGSDFGISSGEREKQVREQLGESSLKFSQTRENLNRVFDQLFTENQQGFQNEMAKNRETLGEREQYWNELLGMDSQEFQKWLNVAGMGATASAQGSGAGYVAGLSDAAQGSALADVRRYGGYGDFFDSWLS